MQASRRLLLLGRPCLSPSLRPRNGDWHRASDNTAGFVFFSLRRLRLTGGGANFPGLGLAACYPVVTRTQRLKLRLVCADLIACQHRPARRGGPCCGAGRIGIWTRRPHPVRCWRRRGCELRPFHDGFDEALGRWLQGAGFRLCAGCSGLLLRLRRALLLACGGGRRGRAGLGRSCALRKGWLRNDEECGRRKQRRAGERNSAPGQPIDLASPQHHLISSMQPVIVIPAPKM